MRLHCLTIEITPPGNAHVPLTQPMYFPRPYRALVWLAGIFAGGWPWGDHLVFPGDIWLFPTPRITGRRILSVGGWRWERLRGRSPVYSIAMHFDWIASAYFPHPDDLDTLPF